MKNTEFEPLHMVAQYYKAMESGHITSDTLRGWGTCSGCDTCPAGSNRSGICNYVVNCCNGSEAFTDALERLLGPTLDEFPTGRSLLEQHPELYI